MQKICKECNGRGYYDYYLDSYDDDFDSGCLDKVELSCGECDGAGYIEVESVKFLVKTDDKSFIIDIEISEEGFSEIDLVEILSSYMDSHYEGVRYSYETIGNEVVEIYKNEV